MFITKFNTKSRRKPNIIIKVGTKEKRTNTDYRGVSDQTKL